MKDKWSIWYKDAADETRFQDSDTTTYEIAAKFLADMKTVEDWGCGYGGFKPFCKGQYTGVDGSKTPYVDKIVDLCTYTSAPEGIVMRHVLEHNYSWDQVLTNAISSAKKKLCLIFFTPLGETTEELRFTEDVGVPDLSLAKKDVEKYLKGCKWETIKHRHETVYLITKKK
jgi:hypothetical protein